LESGDAALEQYSEQLWLIRGQGIWYDKLTPPPLLPDAATVVESNPEGILQDRFISFVYFSAKHVNVWN
jgi:hypothetical protein